MENMAVLYGIIVALLGIASAELSPGQVNVCQKTISFRENFTESYISSVRVKDYTWCLGVIPRCTKWRTQYRTGYRLSTRLASKIVYECCPGYQNKEDLCLPHCPSGCVHGACIGPGVCDCAAGWRGANCNSACPVGSWGENCARSCQCDVNNAVCDVETGHCSCHSGFRGKYCHLPCISGTFGPHCEEECKCIAGQASCDPVSGRCQCHDGFHGPLCDKMCPEEISGRPCPDDCPCQNGGQCKDGDLTCDCPDGWTGPVCAVKCPAGTFGKNCSRPCLCYNGGSCDHVTGRCVCPPGYTGDKCEKTCPMGKFGTDCQHECECQNEGYCSHVDGRCTCAEQWMGLRCELKVCELGFWGPKCSSRCKCILENSICDPWDGSCTCKPGFRGPLCGRRCEDEQFGLGCVQQCHCKASQYCDHMYGCVANAEEESVNDKKEDVSGSRMSLYMVSAAMVLGLSLLLLVCLMLYYRRRYRRLKHTTELVVEYTRTDMGDPGAMASGGAEIAEAAAAPSEKSKMLEAEGCGSYRDVGYQSDSDVEQGATNRRPIYTGPHGSRSNDPPSAARGNRHPHRTRDTGRESPDNSHPNQSSYAGMPEEPPPPYTPNPPLPSPPPPYSVDTPAGKANSKRSKSARGEPSGACGGACNDPLRTGENMERGRLGMPGGRGEAGRGRAQDFQHQNTENETREKSMSP